MHPTRKCIKSLVSWLHREHEVGLNIQYKYWVFLPTCALTSNRNFFWENKGKLHCWWQPDIIYVNQELITPNHP